MPLPVGVAVERVTDLTSPLAIRAEVFIEGQGVSLADEVDGRDPDCLHWLMTDAEGPVATLRVLPIDADRAKVQRVAVLARARGRGLGALLMRFVLSDLQLQGFSRITLGAQVDVIGFYERLGFAAHGPVYDDAGIPHRDMDLTF
ncbi:GNAT family N-acetyltransferase [Jannaschia pohangensis]|uniref:ElaA protein n=1 Tax=Jannaschia pohangensis TaxID=390807 RepID=A0A1I3T6U7_9RHOB|nr:GNAT family N-acetyltransferase [Jannaschia pohangensis]SFJ66705.1 ElaA protein [Jannaschia pohangensis]